MFLALLLHVRPRAVLATSPTPDSQAPVCPLPAGTEQPSRGGPLPFLPSTSVGQQTVLSPHQIEKLRFKEVKLSLPAHHLAICGSLCLEQSSPVTTPSYVHTLPVSPQTSLRGPFPEHLPAIFLLTPMPSHGTQLPHVCVSCPCSTRVPNEGLRAGTAV